MPNKQLSDWQKVVIMACAPFFGNRAIAKKANCSVWAVRKYRNRMKEREAPLDVDEEEDAVVTPEGMSVLDDIVQAGLDERDGRI
ncbi:hypothetical protein [Halomicrococcus gelatinilyticus]|uniref:hypothetical protein n=1 Tax=Halomicrococcus gelatinilyticus TaxID=1702103 RepID=UPI002E16398B